MPNNIQTIFLVFTCLIQMLIMGSHDFDFKIWRSNGTLPGGCYLHQENIIYCYKVSDHPTKHHLVAVKQCESQNGQLATNLTKDIWPQIIYDITQPNTTKTNIVQYMWLGLKTPAKSQKLHDVHGQEFNITEDSIWANVEQGQAVHEHCTHASMINGNIYSDGTACSSAASFFYLCEYRIILGCNSDTLRDELPNATFNLPNSNECFKLEGEVDDHTTLNINCNEGFVPDGPSIITCQFGKWTQLPQCIQGCHLPENRKRSKLWFYASKTYFETGEKALFVCNDGYVNPKGNTKDYFTIICAESGEWSDSNTDCVTEGNFDVINIKVREKYQPVKLKCPIWHADLRTHEVVWFKNDQSLTGNDKYIIDKNGTLLITKMTGGDIGFYNCLLFKDNTTTSFKSNRWYHVAYHSDCSTPNYPLYESVYSEGEAAILRCQPTSPLFTFKWYKNERVLSNNENHIVIPTGSLYFEKFRLIDSGTYRCEVINEATYCSHNVTHKVTILPKIQNPCTSQVPTADAEYNASSLLLTQPWLVKVWDKDELLPSCYATIILEEWVITTASCLHKFRRVRSNVLNVEIGPNMLPVKLLMFHPRFRRGHPENDVALIKLPKINFTDNVLPACVVDKIIDIRANPCEVFSGVVGGWGSLDVDDETELMFNIENFVIGDLKICREIGSLKFAVGMFCAKGTGKPAYVGDFGAPFVTKSKGRVNLIGIYSWGLREMQKGEYDFFTDITFHYKWIQNVTSM